MNAPAGRTSTAELGRVVLLLSACALVFGRMLGHGFVLFDDSKYVVDNAMVQRGLTLEGLRWAFTNVEQYHWHPLTWLSHMLDAQLFGLQAWGHHATSLVVHALNTLLVYALLRRTTDAPWGSALVAALFALHPTHVESVAWVSGRKDLLAALFGLGSLHAYVTYARALRRRWLVATTTLIALGLLAKSSIIVWPALLLVLDLWPLHRIASATRVGLDDGSALFPTVSWQHAVIEKILVAAPALAMLPVVVLANVAGSLAELHRYVPTPGTIGMALDAAVFYARLTLWPEALHTPRELLYTIAWWRVLLAILVLTTLTLGALRWRGRQPWLLAGWAWYLVVLAPVSGLVLAGPAARADRYTYLSTIGLLIALVWGGRAALRAWPRWRALGWGLSLGCVACSAGLAYRQVGTWRDEWTLSSHAVRCDPNNSFAHNNLGVALERQGRDEEALAAYQRAFDLNDDLSIGLLNLARLASRLQRVDQAATAWTLYVKWHPQDVETALEAASALLQLGKPAEAARSLEPAIARHPEEIELLAQRAVARVLAGQLELAEGDLERVIRRAPTHVEASYRLGAIRAFRGRLDEAIALYRTAQQHAPERTDVLTDLASALAQQGRLDEARTTLERALRVDPRFEPARAALAALAGAGASTSQPATMP